ncbi:NAD(P)H-dependent oxidoreductase [uncultured Umboniibacter sp.]|uniref:NAD(P)H-dependent oxidoreductase n=1 Tax=uncultured Umboniibacter sp. TaxID=1798917 RepID=UPI002636CAA9|nr:NAD(P)H-dependent oxidoreductase [uncultured Umboniibacter sp.]
MTPRKVLVLFAHPALDASVTNAPLFKTAQQTEGVTAVDLYAEYPKHHIDVEREQQRLLEHDVVIFQFPMFWYSTPAMLKEWQDLVLEYGFAYGSDGTALKGKILLCSLTAGGAESDYCSEGQNQYTIPQLLRPVQQMASLCQMHFLPPLVLFGSRTAKQESRLSSHNQLWKQVLSSLQHSPIQLTGPQTSDLMNDAYTSLFTAKGNHS